MEREYYLIGDAATKAKCTASDLIYCGKMGRLDLYALMRGGMAEGTFWDSDPRENEYAESSSLFDGHQNSNFPSKSQLTGHYLLMKFDIERIEAGDVKPLVFVSEKFLGEGRDFIVWELEEPIPLSDLKIVVLSKDISKFISDKPEQPEPKQPEPKAINEINQVWQSELESMAAELIKQHKKSLATKRKLAKTLGEKIDVDPATIERQTRKTW